MPHGDGYPRRISRDFREERNPMGESHMDGRRLKLQHGISYAIKLCLVGYPPDSMEQTTVSLGVNDVAVDLYTYGIM